MYICMNASKYVYLLKQHGDLHYNFFSPWDGVSVEICSRIKPEVDPLLFVSSAICEDIGLQEVWLATHIAQELEI